MTLSCPAAQELSSLADLGLAQALEPHEPGLLRDHLAACPGCRDDGRALAAVAAAERASLDQACAAPPPSRVRERLLAAAGAPAKKPCAAAPQVDPERVEAVGRRIALSCSYCHARAAREEVAFCAACLAPHHADCFAEHGRCALPGCEERETVRPHAAPGGTRRRRAGRLVGLVLAGGVACAAAWSGSAEARREAPPSDLGPQRVTVDVQGVDLANVVAGLGREVGRNILVSPEVREEVTLELRDVPWTEALRAIALRTGCRVERRPGGILVLHQPPRVTIQFTDANIRTVLQLLAAYSGKNIVVAADVEGSITLDLKDVPWDEALLALARTQAFHIARQGEVLFCSARPRDGAPFTLEEDWTTPAPAPPRSRTPAAVVDLVHRDAPLSEVCAALGRQCGRSIEVYFLDREEPRVTIDLRGVDWRAALDAVAEQARALVREATDGRLFLVPPPPFTYQTTDVRATTLLQLLAAYAHVNLVIPRGGDVCRTLTLDLKDLEPYTALVITALHLGWPLEREGDLVKIVPPPEQACPLRVWRGGGGWTEVEAVTPDLRGAVIGGRTYAVGGALLDEAGAPTGQVVAAIEERSVRLRYADGCTEDLGVWVPGPEEELPTEPLPPELEDR